MRRRKFLRLEDAAEPLLQEDEARRIAERILSYSRADDASVTLVDARRTNTRYAVNRITTAGESHDLTAAVTACFGRRSATVSLNEFDEASLRGASGRAEDLARLAPEDPEAMPLLGPQEYAKSSGWHETTAWLDAQSRASVAAAAIRRAAGHTGITVAGYLETRAGATALANTAGLFAYHPSTAVSYSLTARTGDGTGSGWAGIDHRDWSAVDAEALHATAVDKAMRSREPQPLEPGTYPVILEPQAVSDLVGLLAGALDARAADEGRSAFAAPGGTKIGEQVVDERVTLRSDPAGAGDPPFGGDGVPARPIAWIEGGVLRNLAYSRYWASQQGAEPTGRPSALSLDGGEGSLADLIASTDRAVLVTRLWYIRSLDPRTVLHTGLTRDGTFWVENGRISHPVNNFRWNDSPLSVLRRLDRLGRSVRVAGDGAVREVPPLRATGFHFSSVSEAV